MGEKAKETVAAELRSGSVLDIACGTGTLLVMAQEKGLECYGIDTAPGMIDVAKKKVSQGSFKIASFLHLPFTDASFDNVIETNAVSGISIGVDKVFEEMIRVCKPGGNILIGDYCSPPKTKLMTQLMIRIGNLIGDQPHDFAGIFGDLGIEPVVEILGWGGIYQLIHLEVP